MVYNNATVQPNKHTHQWSSDNTSLTVIPTGNSKQGIPCYNTKTILWRWQLNHRESYAPGPEALAINIPTPGQSNAQPYSR